jgi:hypothetical protein
MTTSRKSEFAPANGAKSRGPITPEGNLASSQNATQHGIFSRTMVPQCESQLRFEPVLAELQDQVQPRDATESGYVDIMAIARWREMVRLESSRIESARTESAQAESGNASTSEAHAAGLTRVVLATLAYQTLSGNSFPDNLHCYETSYDRQFAKAQAAIRRMPPVRTARPQILHVLPSGPVASVPHLATPLTAPTSWTPRTPAKKVILQNEPTAQNET